MSKQARYMRILLFFDLPQQKKSDQKKYQQFVKNLKQNGFFRIQFSVYARLCGDHQTANSIANRIKKIAPRKGDVSYLIISEQVYQKMVRVNEVYSFQERVVTKDRLLIIGGDNDN